MVCGHVDRGIFSQKAPERGVYQHEEQTQNEHRCHPIALGGGIAGLDRVVEIAQATLGNVLRVSPLGGPAKSVMNSVNHVEGLELNLVAACVGIGVDEFLDAANQDSCKCSWVG
jgi:hypothetical protein